MSQLIVIDMQNDFRPSDEVVNNVVKKIEKHIANNDRIYLTMDYHTKENYSKTEESLVCGEHCMRNGSGGNFIPEVGEVIALYRKRKILEKDTFGSFALIDALKNDFQNLENNSIEIVGVASDVCVITNALMLRSAFPQCKITVDASCCSGITPEGAEAAYKVMKSCAINVIGY